MNMTTPSHSTPMYVCTRIRAILKKQGWPLHKMKGRYNPVWASQTGTEGYSVHKIGCSKTISVRYVGAYAGGRTLDIPRETRLAREAEAVALLRGLGYRIDSRGWIECDHHDNWD